MLAAAADPVRLRILQALAVRRCVTHLQEIVPLPMNALSYHLRILREAGLVQRSRRGRWIDYCLAPDAIERLHGALPAGVLTDSDACCGCRSGRGRVRRGRATVGARKG